MKANDLSIVTSSTAAALPPQPVSIDVLLEKYAKHGEQYPDDIRRRVARALAQVEPEDKRSQWTQRFFRAQADGFLPAGRICSAAGTELKATLANCFVQPVGDSISADNGQVGIYDALTQAAETMRRGGGVGYDFSPIRPRGALVRGTMSRASGPVSYMQVFDRSCETVESAGARRGAQMAVVSISHPDALEFIRAKDEGGLANFNLSLAVSDAFMAAVQADAEWELVHAAQPTRELIDVGAYVRSDGRWVYRKVRARALWQQVMQSTYDHAEPGVLFLDTVHRDNNLAYRETIAACNPCAEQFLPAYGCCCLGSLNLTRFVVAPFTDAAEFDLVRMREVATVAVRMLDNVLEATVWPLPQQEKEAMAKRRIGLGFTGLGDALIMLGLKYDEDEARAMAAVIARELRDAAYLASVQLAREKGAFPLFDAEQYLAAPSFASRLPAYLQDLIRQHGIRNSHLLAIAPTGTISLAFADNASGGIEPAFAWGYTRKKRMADDSTKAYQVEDHAFRLYRHLHGEGPLPPAFVSALEISALDHLRMVAAVQPFIDSSISKTVNVPADTPFEDFADLYTEAWKAGLKGISTYRPNEVIGSVLEAKPAASALAPQDLDVSDPDRRIKLDRAPAPPLASLRWPGRPVFPDGNPCWTYSVAHPLGNFAVFIGHIENGDAFPFEVWVNGAEQPRGLGAIAKTLSMDMRANDRAWLDMKLAALEKARGAMHSNSRCPRKGRRSSCPVWCLGSPGSCATAATRWARSVRPLRSLRRCSMP